MKLPSLFSLASALVLFTFAAGSAFAKSPASGRGNTRPEVPKINAEDATIEKVGSLSIAVKSGKHIRSYGIDDHTAVYISNRRSSVGALLKGMRVSVHASTLDPSVAQSISVDDPTVRTADPAKPAAAASNKSPAAKKK